MRQKESCQGEGINPVPGLPGLGLHLALICYTLCMKLALKITPQRSTQYANMTEMLAAPELLASPLGTSITQIEPATLAGQPYLLVNISEESVGASEAGSGGEGLYGRPLSLPALLDILARLGATSEAYEYFEYVGEIQGPLLRPLEP